MTTIFIAGATGFIGSAIAEAAETLGHSVTLLCRKTTAERSHPSRRLDLLGGVINPALLDGASVLIHSASYVGPDVDLQRRINIEGTRNLMRAARQAQLDKIVYMSTAGVYGTCFPVGLPPRPNAEPRSSLSASRYEAETLVLEAGGSVVRPNFVFGAGDRWFLGRLLHLARLLDGSIEHGSALFSVIDRSSLGVLAARLALSDRPQDVFHAAYPKPVRVASLLTVVSNASGIDVSTRSFTRDEAQIRLAECGIREEEVAMLCRDRWFKAGELWEVAGKEPPATLALSQSDAAWYLSHQTNT